MFETLKTLVILDKDFRICQGGNVKWWFYELRIKARAIQRGESVIVPEAAAVCFHDFGQDVTIAAKPTLNVEIIFRNFRH